MVDVHMLAYQSGLDPKELAHWQTLVSGGSGYTRMSIPQKRRRPREVARPSVGLDRLLKQLSKGLSRVSNYNAPPMVHGFVKGRDIRTNAANHLNQDVVLRVDLRDFFGSIDRPRILKTLAGFDFEAKAAEAVAGVTLVDGSLAQGFSTSPLLSNMAFLDVDVTLSSVAESKGVRYTRYVDDLTFSGAQEVVHDDFLQAITSTLNTSGWTVNPGKTRFMRRGKAQYVTGLFVGDEAGPHIPRSMKRLLRREVYYAARFGLEDARLRSPTPVQHDRLNGWVHYAAYADPVVGEKLREAWNSVPSRRYQGGLGRDWERILEEIGFPSHW